MACISLEHDSLRPIYPHLHICDSTLWPSRTLQTSRTGRYGESEDGEPYDDNTNALEKFLRQRKEIKGKSVM